MDPKGSTYPYSRYFEAQRVSCVVNLGLKCVLCTDGTWTFADCKTFSVEGFWFSALSPECPGHTVGYQAGFASVSAPKFLM